MPNASMMGLLQTLPAPVLTVAYAGEINQLSPLLEEFLELRQNRNSAKAQDMAEKLDTKIQQIKKLLQINEDDVELIEVENKIKSAQSELTKFR